MHIQSIVPRQGKRTYSCFPGPEEELYNVKKDPYQLHNLAEVKSNQETLNFLQKVLDAWILETGDSVPEQPRADREDVYGHIVSSAWEKEGEKPGESNHATEINHPGPVVLSNIR